MRPVTSRRAVLCTTRGIPPGWPGDRAAGRRRRWQRAASPSPSAPTPPASIRVPSSFCGVAGLKPTQDRLSMRRHHAARPVPRLRGASRRLRGRSRRCLRRPGGRARVGRPDAGASSRAQVARAPAGYFAEGIHPDVRRALNARGRGACGGRADGHGRVPARNGERARHLGGHRVAGARGQLPRSRPEPGRQPDCARTTGTGRTCRKQRKVRARAQAGEIRRSFLAALRHADALLLPCTPYSAPRLSDAEIDVGGGQAMNVFHGGPTWFTCPVNIAGLPAVALPAGFDAKGLPLGVQLVGRPGGEWTLLRIGLAFEAGAPGSSSRKINGERRAAWKRS